MRGGVKIYRGAAAAARHYVETDRGRADEYYLAEGSGIAERYVASSSGDARQLASLTGDAYESWVGGFDPDTGTAKGRLRHDENAVRFVEVIVNGPKSWSLAAELHPDISAAYDAAQDGAARQIVGWLAQHATTRVGPRGAQVQVPVDQIDGVAVRHRSSRAGDPHRHLHLQVNSRVLVRGQWRGLHTVGMRDSLDAINGIGHAAVMTDPGFRAALAAHGFTLDPDTGEVTQLVEFVGPFSARATQIARNIDRYEAAWRAANPRREAGPALRRSWDARAWADARPDKIVPRNGAELTRRWVAELHELGYHELIGRHTPLQTRAVGSLDRDAAVAEVLARLGARRSAWNAADIRGEVEQLIARRGIVTDTAVRSELAEDLTARAITACVPLLGERGVPEHVRALTSPEVLDTEADIADRLASLAEAKVSWPEPVSMDAVVGLDPGLDVAQRAVVAALGSGHALVVVEGAAGAGKTTTLAATRAMLEQSGARLLVATPTRKAARVAATQVGTQASSAAWLVHQHGYRWATDGTWTRLTPGQIDPATGATFTGPSPEAALGAGDLLLVDEAGMLDQDSARALLTITDEHQARVALVGDRHQLPAVGRGGVLDLAARVAAPEACLTLDTVHRFTRTVEGPDGTARTVPDDDYAELSLAMRTGTDPAAVFDALHARGQIQVHASDAQRRDFIAATVVAGTTQGAPAALLVDTREQVTQLNELIRDGLVAAGRIDERRAVTTTGGQRIGAGDRVVTRHNDRDLRVANRDTWTVQHIAADGSVSLTGAQGARELPTDYVREHLELAYASTVYGAQGDTVLQAHVIIGEHTTAASAYVAMTRGRELNVAHLVAATVDDAREQWLTAFARDRADLGPSHAAELARIEAGRYAPLRPLHEVLPELHRAWTSEADCDERLTRVQEDRDSLVEITAIQKQRQATVPPLKLACEHAREQYQRAAAKADQLDAVVTAQAAAIAEQLRRDWDLQREPARQAAYTLRAGPGRLGQRRGVIRHAAQQLEQWSDRWQPYLPSPLPDLDAITAFAAWHEDPTRIQAAFDQDARARADQANPRFEAARANAERALQERNEKERRLHDAVVRYDFALYRYGPVGRTKDPTAALEQSQTLLETLQHDADTARQRVAAVLADPALQSLPTQRIATERDRWLAERDERRRTEATLRSLTPQRQLDPSRDIHAQPWTEHSPDIDRSRPF